MLGIDVCSPHLCSRALVCELRASIWRARDVTALCPQRLSVFGVVHRGVTLPSQSSLTGASVKVTGASVKDACAHLPQVCTWMLRIEGRHRGEDRRLGIANMSTPDGASAVQRAL